MAITTTYHYTMDLDKGGLREVLHDPLYTLNSKAHTFAIEVKQGASAASLNGAKCTGYFIRTDGVTVPIDGAVSGNVASVTLLPNCYAVQGRFDLSVDLILGDVIHTILHVDGSILRSRTDSMTTGGSKVQSFDELVSAVQGVDAAMKRRDRVVNLLDNSDFRNPVNQRGLTSYVNVQGCNIDRWQQTNTKGTLMLESGCVSIKSTNGDQYFFSQYIPAWKVNASKAHTFAICDTAGEVAVVSAVYSTDMETKTVYHTFTASGTKVSLRMSYSSSRDCYRVMIEGAHTETLSLVWAALYEGTYTADTLPEYQPKENELAMCRRFHRPIAFNGFLGFAVRNADGYGFQGLVPGEPMRIEAPTIVGTIAAWDGVNSHTISELSEFVWTGNGYRIAGKTTAQGTPGETLGIYAVSGVAINADL